MNEGLKQFLVGISSLTVIYGILFGWTSLHLNRYQTSLNCREEKCCISYNRRNNSFEQSQLTYSKIFPKQAKEKLVPLRENIKGDFNGDGIEDLVEIKEEYEGRVGIIPFQIPIYHKELIINNKKVGNNFYHESVGFEESKDVNSDGIEDIIITAIDGVYR